MVSIDDMPELFASFDSKYRCEWRALRLLVNSVGRIIISFDDEEPLRRAVCC